MSKTSGKSENLSKSWVYRPAIVITSIFTTTTLFVYLNNVQTNFYIDEEFHIGQTLRYCRGKFFEWDSKITTLPGLYVIASLFLAPVGLCKIFWMRCINLLGTIANFYLLYRIIQEQGQKNKNSISISWNMFGSVISLAYFPPLYFWFFLYYTDVLSLNFVLLTWLMHLRGRYQTAALTGSMAIFMRQTNVIWVGAFAAERIVDLLEAQTPKSISTLVSRNIHNTPMHAKLVWKNLYYHVARGPRAFGRFIVEMLKEVRAYALVGAAFVLFLIINGGIVVGDRKAHVATIHLPQIFYYSVFSMLFAWPYMLPHAREFLHWVRRKWIVTSVLLAVATIIVHSNTLVHPYVLADNRHYVFYIWNRFMGRYYVMRYLLIPIYGFAFYAHYACLKNVRFLSQMIYIAAVCVVLIPQLLLEPRYFIVPYIFLRLKMSPPTKWQIICELITTAIINFVQFFIFVNKTFYWTDGEYLQRISW
ncbi:putative Dol-P-Glc:Glc(2)Man(9)GlcNAc(2)-PP-Dol alpha-1,2-glucosyltransferase [Venturia canescens]|uniref:putative Dol-P-Glc:Glc(2)Man(9)GlcNAc(2)-PP-Dol alpha-1,2-glucosyltransferase n=1 Tax=Venturia canescens TaxID=32260 RepID=UPI001C9CFBF0|nr:putative Dol-P-Glc:Glc(2)Man(9)GlcNAc(2)-PP-Dol alpha-1,2-glucosyltransferase [Venturia canescens]